MPPKKSTTTQADTDKITVDMMCLHEVADFKKAVMQSLYGNMPECIRCHKKVKLEWVDA